ncbi:unnamed protein product [Pleuronectes platessa]|uniref:Uncharacterized protein n=1 Tax=Pleuronectes platessa TaxID=8262 RepID=A0A9N7VEZ6_PLEPL|nr:unnamed protein product [Pleuronectes platessa]
MKVSRGMIMDLFGPERHLRPGNSTGTEIFNLHGVFCVCPKDSRGSSCLSQSLNFRGHMGMFVPGFRLQVETPDILMLRPAAELRETLGVNKTERREGTQTRLRWTAFLETSLSTRPPVHPRPPENLRKQPGNML